MQVKIKYLQIKVHHAFVPQICIPCGRIVPKPSDYHRSLLLRQDLDEYGLSFLRIHKGCRHELRTIPQGNCEGSTESSVSQIKIEPSSRLETIVMCKQSVKLFVF